MILLLHPRATKPKNRRLPLAVLSLAAVLEGREEYTLVDGNLDPAPGESLDRLMRDKPAELLAVSVMPGPQMVAAIPLCRAFREKYPAVPIVWGGYFPSLHPDAALNASYVDYVVRGQGEETLLELLEALRGRRELGSVRGLSWKDGSGLHVHNPERALRSPNEFPWLPYHRLDMPRYLLPTFLGSRTAVHQASIGCPYRCNFCGVVPVYGGQKMESPARTAAVLEHLRERYGANAVQFYDNNFFLREDHARELADLGLRRPEDGIARAHGRRSGAPAGTLRRQRGAILRQQLFPARGPRAGTGRAPPAAGDALVVRGARGHRAGLFGRHAAETAGRRLHHDLLRRGIRFGRGASRNAQEPAL